MAMREIDLICYACMKALNAPGSVCPHCGWDNAVRSGDWSRLPAMTLKGGRFFVGRPLGAGGFGITYLGRDLLAGEFEDARRAIKEFFPAGVAVRGSDGLSVRPMGAEQMERFERRRQKARDEGGRMAALSGRVNNVVRAFDCFEENNTVYTVMEYIDGDTLTDIVRRDGPMHWQEALRLMTPVLTALRDMHARGIYHMDISPENIMFRREPDGSRGAPVILDFGASIEAGATDVTRTRSAAIVRDGYTPPEQYVNSDGATADAARMDEYAICATIYYAVTGQAPTSSMARKIGGKVRPLSAWGVHAPASFESALNRGMDMLAERRYASIEELTAALRGRGRGRWKVAALCAAFCAAGAAIALALAPGGIMPKKIEPTEPPAIVEAPAPEPTPTSAPTPEPTEAAPTAAAPVRDTDYPALTRDADDIGLGSETPVLGHDTVRRRDILSITFRPTLDDAPEDAWDVSENGSGRVLAWVSRSGNRYDLTIAGDGGVKILAPREASALFAAYDHAEVIDLNGCVDLSGRKDLSGLFDGCERLRRVSLAGICTAGASDMRFMFRSCRSLEALDLSGLDTSGVSAMEGMFMGCRSLKGLDLSGLDTSGVTAMDGMFEDCAGLEALDLSGLDTARVTSMRDLFRNCASLGALNLSGLDTAQAADLSGMFEGCSALRALDLSGLDTSAAVDMSRMFSRCWELRSLDVGCMDTSSVERMDGMFYQCSGLRALDLSGFDLRNVRSMTSMFQGCYSLRTIGRDQDRFGHGDAGDLFDGCDALEPYVPLMVRDTDFPVLMRAADDADTVPGNPGVKRDQIVSITFRPSLESAPADAWDVSENQDGRVLAWVAPNGDLYDLSIAGDGGVRIPDPAGEPRPFYAYGNVETIDFNGCVDLSGRKNLSRLFSGFASLRRVRLTGVCTAGAADMRYMFYGCRSLTQLDVSGFDTSNVMDMSGMFEGCAGLETLDVSGFDTSNVTNMSGMFRDCASLEALDAGGFDTSHVNDMSFMFSGCRSLRALDAAGFDTSRAAFMNSMFNNCSGLEALDVSGLDTSNATRMQYMFNGCQSLGSLDVSGFDTSKAQYMADMFAGCERLEALDVSGFDTSRAEDMQNMFSGCGALRTIGCDPGAFGHGKTDGMFDGCDALEPYVPPMVRDTDFPVLTRAEYDESPFTAGNSVPGNRDLQRKQIASITFYPSLENVPADAWDVSENQDGRVMAWVTPNGNRYDLSIAGDGGVKILDPKGESRLFFGYVNVKTIDFNGCVDLSGRRNLSCLFRNCTRLKRVNLSGVCTAAATDMSYMFNRCSQLESIDLSGFDTSNVTLMSEMFRDCQSLAALDLTGFNTSRVQQMRSMFSGCKKLEAVDVSGFDTSQVQYMTYMFYGCESLRTIGCDPKDFGHGNTEHMFTGCGALEGADR